MPDYLSAGYNDFLLRPLEAGFVEQVGLDSSSSFEQISGLQVKGDKIISSSKNLTLDLQNDSFIVKNGDFKRVEMGKLFDGTVGLIIRNEKDNVLVNISGETNKISSPSGNFEIDFNEEKLTLKNKDNQTFIDANGLLSTANFQGNIKNANSLQDNITSTSYIDVLEPQLNFIASTESFVRLLVFGTITTGITPATESGSPQVIMTLEDNISLANEFLLQAAIRPLIGMGSFIGIIPSLAAGSHTLKFRIKAVAPSLTGVSVRAIMRSIGYLILGT